MLFPPVWRYDKLVPRVFSVFKPPYLKQLLNTGPPFPYHWITEAVIVIYLVQQKILTNLHVLALYGPKFYSCS